MARRQRSGRRSSCRSSRPQRPSCTCAHHNPPQLAQPQLTDYLRHVHVGCRIKLAAESAAGSDGGLAGCLHALYSAAYFEEAALEHWHDAVATAEQKEECGELMAWLGEVEEEEPDDG